MLASKPTSWIVVSLLGIIAGACSQGSPVVVATRPTVSIVSTTIVDGAGSVVVRAKPGPPSPPRSHTVEAGDTLASIAEAMGVTAEEIARASNLREPNDLRVGQKLVVPPLPTTTTGATPSTTSAASSPASPSSSTQASPSSASTSTSTIARSSEYTVRSGDTLDSIAKQFDMTAGDIVRASKLTDPDKLTVGQKVTIPALPTTTSASR